MSGAKEGDVAALHSKAGGMLSLHKTYGALSFKSNKTNCKYISRLFLYFQGETNKLKISIPELI